MSPRKRLSAMTAVSAALAIAAPVAAAGAAVPSSLLGSPAANPNICLHGVVDPGPFGPSGPYGASGPYGPDGPLHGQPNPIGDAASCGGLLTLVLRGDTVSSFVNANLASVGITPPSPGR